ncbi:response regulator transcription factor [Erythrobacter donghaensis]|uniref:response regulator transcription factor n=1 Tax=Erythrobacter donghaensis TaxID=267135 RepID=UPI000A36A4F2|nr:response regulator transcription factor [Erythrobacter donghaensis]
MNAPPPFGQFPGLDFPALRFREAGDVTLDLVHRDARVVDCWLALSEGEFALLWQLAEAPGTRVTGGHPAPGEWPFLPVPKPPAASPIMPRAFAPSWSHSASRV